jgi:hypothetical protein
LCLRAPRPACCLKNQRDEQHPLPFTMPLCVQVGALVKSS